MSRQQKREEADNVIDLGHTNKYYHYMLNMADDDLNPFEYRLLGHYRRVCGLNGTCTQGVRKIAKTCQMSVGMVTKTREALAASGWIHAEKRDSDNGYNVTLIDRMRENVDRYADKAKGVHTVNTPVHTVNTGVHVVNERINQDKNQQEQKQQEIAPVPDAPASKPSKKEKPADPNAPVIAALISTWAKATHNIDKGVYANKTNRKQAQDMIDAGVTPELLNTFLTSLMQDAFWRKNPPTFSKTLQKIGPWITSRGSSSTPQQPLSEVAAERTVPLTTPSEGAKPTGDGTLAAKMRAAAEEIARRNQEALKAQKEAKAS